jgi:ABC-type transport system involved in cytochrome c biogenesis permease subunit
MRLIWSTCCSERLRFQARRKVKLKLTERVTPAAALIAALSAVACCLPLSFLAGAGLLGASSRFERARPWLLVASAVLLVLGFIQLYVRRARCQRRSRLSIVIFWVAAAIVLLVILFPQIFASILAG